MKRIVLSSVLMFLLQVAIPYWWWVMVIPFCVAVFSTMSLWGAFRMGLFSAGLVWTLASVALLLTQSHLIADRVAVMMGLGNGWILALLTGVMGMVAGGVSGATGQALRSCVKNPAGENGEEQRVSESDQASSSSRAARPSV